ncbi:enamine deaminase RidA (YjgF/YER057c/UK114 family) [Haloactinopolyspora alba]|uniref:Enamine deaminase RidA (YjgF/YER057c/UK114 family) n=1 Tax=Haloactinopolyspora alba TaxID=648780 RepID=A0A2P8EG91_9ACTN|nr:RidA family protein [Haloactinopolyspora alba]PSL08480.1 enamine deaminase RidA (YjgF/YER057c/UK114 family) [Haloactinopolyspora alba]
MREHIRQPEGLPPTNAYSHVVSYSGRTVAVSGQVPLDSTGDLVGRGDAEAQIRQVFRNVSTALAAAGAGMRDVVKLTVFLIDLADLPLFRQVRDEYIVLSEPPASSLVQVSGLVNPEFRVEVEAWAAV